MQPRDGEHDGLERIACAADGELQRSDERGGGNDGVAREVRQCGVAAGARERHDELAARGEERPRA